MIVVTPFGIISAQGCRIRTTLTRRQCYAPVQPALQIYGKTRDETGKMPGFAAPLPFQRFM
jgi:hypothetical protein